MQKEDRKGAGYVVEIASGRGRTRHADETINGKIVVYLDDGRRFLCSREKIKIIGFVD